MRKSNQRNLQGLIFKVLVVFAISIYSCRKDNDEECCDPTNPECPNYDPCSGVEEPSAAFLMEDLARDNIEGEWIFYPEEDLFRGAEIRFRSTHTGSEYQHTWYVGTDTIYESSVTKDFSEVNRPATITISHVLEYPVDSVCYPLSTGKDSVAQSFDLMNYWNELLTIGNTFRGVLENQTDSFDFRLRLLEPDGTPSYWGDINSNGSVYHINMHNEGDSTILSGTIPINHYVSFGHSSVPQGNLEIDPESKKVRMEYRWTDYEDYVFTGRVID